MQVLIYKAALTDLKTNPTTAGISPGDVIGLELGEDGQISARALLTQGKWIFQRTRSLPIGTLEPQATALLSPALERNAHLRVRIVEIEPAHLARGKVAKVFISVWGDPEDLEPPKTKTTIFSRSRIND
ncbi:MAG: hypothetical protein EBS68_14575 [Rhodobacteraceae bacterium]|jgi:hypothetical protein|nr:hypothetical protein [Paracoccaceae bacterium]